MIIADGRIKAAGCILPVAQNANLPKDLGLRHRSALGMSLDTDALIIIVSEERGKISVAHNGKLAINISAEELQQITVKCSESGRSGCNSFALFANSMLHFVYFCTRKQ